MTEQGGFDIGGLLQQAQAMQEQMAAAQEAQSEEVVEGSASGGLVKVKMKGSGEFVSVSIDPGAVDSDDLEMLEDLVLAALRDAAAQVMQLQQESMGGLDLPDLGGLGGLLGGS